MVGCQVRPEKPEVRARAVKNTVKSPVVKTKAAAKQERDRLAQVRLVTLSSEAIELRKAGATYRQIADQLGITTTEAHTVVQKGLKEILLDSGAEDVVNLELARLDEMTLQCFIILRDDKARYDQKLRSIDRMITIMERRAKFLGLDAPEKIDMNVSGRIENVHAVIVEGDSDSYIAALERSRAIQIEAARGELVEAGQAEGIEEAEIVEDFDEIFEKRGIKIVRE